MRANRITNILLHATIGVFFAFFYAHLTLDQFEKFDLKRRDFRGEIDFELPAREVYLLKVWGSDIPDSVFFNAEPLVHSILRDRVKPKELYYVLPARLTKKGINTLRVIPDQKHTIRIKNTIGANNAGVVVFGTNFIARTDAAKNSFPLYFFSVFAFSLLGVLASYFFEKGFSFYPDKFILRCAGSFLPCLLFFFLIYKLNAVMPLRLLFFRQAFVMLFFLIIFIFEGVSFSSFFFREVRIKYTAAVHHKSKDLRGRFLGHKSDFCNRCLSVFIFLLFLSAISLSLKLQFLASWSGNIAYLALVAGVILKLMHERKNSRIH